LENLHVSDDMTHYRFDRKAMG